MHLCSACHRLKTTPTALNAPPSFELNRRLPVATGTPHPVTYSYFTCACGARWVQVKYDSDGRATWKMLR
jgi:hypothetical protein